MLLAAALHHPSWVPVWAFPWMLGSWLLFGRTGEKRIRHALAECPAGATAVSALVLGLLLCFVALVFGVPAVLLAMVWLGVTGFGVLAAGRPERLVRGLSSLALLGVSSAFALGLAELVLRLPPLQLRFGLPNELAAWSERYDKLEGQNVFGFRTPYERVAKSVGVIRIVALGDSFTWGDKVASSDSVWPALLEAALNGHLAGARRVEVVNLGIKGFTTVNEAEMLRRVGWQFDPDLVVVQFLFNDILPSGPNFVSQGSEWLFPRVRILPSALRKGVVRSSHLLHLLEIQISRGMNGSRAAHEKWLALYEKRGSEWSDLENALREMGEAGVERGVPLVFMLFPLLESGVRTVDDHPHHRIHGQVLAAAKDAGMLVLDLTPIFAAEEKDFASWWATPYDRHPGAPAHQLAARALLDFLLTHEPLTRNQGSLLDYVP